MLLLSGNDRIGEDGARHLMVALAANRSLHFLGLNGSNMTCECVLRELRRTAEGHRRGLGGLVVWLKGLESVCMC